MFGQDATTTRAFTYKFCESWGVEIPINAVVSISSRGTMIWLKTKQKEITVSFGNLEHIVLKQ